METSNRDGKWRERKEKIIKTTRKAEREKGKAEDGDYKKRWRKKRKEREEN